MERVADGGPAFPLTEGQAHDVAAAEILGYHGADREAVYLKRKAELCAGMALRDYFAAKAMVRWLPMAMLDEGSNHDGHTRVSQLRTISRNAYAVADAMLAERKQ